MRRATNKAALTDVGPRDSAASGADRSLGGLSKEWQSSLRRRGYLTPAEVAEIQRGRIIAATVEAVAELGYQGLSVAAIIARARLSRKTFYESFSDREACFLATFEWASAHVLWVMGEAYAEETSWSAGVRSALRRLLALMDEEPALLRLLFIDAQRAGEEVALSRAQLLEQVAETLDAGRASPGARGEPPQITAQGIVGSVSTVLQLRLLQGSDEAIEDLLGPLMYIIVLPYLGPAAARRELQAPAARKPRAAQAPTAAEGGSIEKLNIRITYRTLRVLAVIAGRPGASNREVAQHGGISDQGQISKLLRRLEKLGLIENQGLGQPRGVANSWHLTERGSEIARDWGSWVVFGRAEESSGNGNSAQAKRTGAKGSSGRRVP